VEGRKREKEREREKINEINERKFMELEDMHSVRDFSREGSNAI
jgi:hypothetical protein